MSKTVKEFITEFDNKMASFDYAGAAKMWDGTDAHD